MDGRNSRFEQPGSTRASLASTTSRPQVGMASGSSVRPDARNHRHTVLRLHRPLRITDMHAMVRPLKIVDTSKEERGANGRKPFSAISLHGVCPADGHGQALHHRKSGPFSHMDGFGTAVSGVTLPAHYVRPVRVWRLARGTADSETDRAFVLIPAPFSGPKV